MTKLSKAWVEAAGVYESAVNAVRRADYDTSITESEYGDLLELRERAFAALRAVPAPASK